jgi:hypothetical protein
MYIASFVLNPLKYMVRDILIGLETPLPRGT